MPRCHPISLLKLDKKSKEGIKRIAKLKNSALLSSGTLAGGQILLLFVNQNSIGAAMNISSNDWSSFFSALEALPKAFVKEIQNEALYQQLDHFNDRNQKLFWQGVAEGCSEIAR